MGNTAVENMAVEDMDAVINDEGLFNANAGVKIDKMAEI